MDKNTILKTARQVLDELDYKGWEVSAVWQQKALTAFKSTTEQTSATRTWYIDFTNDQGSFPRVYFHCGPDASDDWVKEEIRRQLQNLRGKLTFMEPVHPFVRNVAPTVKAEQESTPPSPPQHEVVPPAMSLPPSPPAADVVVAAKAPTTDPLPPIAEFLKADSEERNASLLRAASEGHVAAVQRLLDEGADVNARMGNGMTPLIRAAFFGHSDMVRALLEHHADTTAKDNLSMTALDWALAKDQIDVIKSLNTDETPSPSIAPTQTQFIPTTLPLAADDQPALPLPTAAAAPVILPTPPPPMVVSPPSPQPSPPLVTTTTNAIATASVPSGPPPKEKSDFTNGHALVDDQDGFFPTPTTFTLDEAQATNKPNMIAQSNGTDVAEELAPQTPPVINRHERFADARETLASTTFETEEIHQSFAEESLPPPERPPLTASALPSLATESTARRHPWFFYLAAALIGGAVGFLLFFTFFHFQNRPAGAQGTNIETPAEQSAQQTATGVSLVPAANNTQIGATRGAKPATETNQQHATDGSNAPPTSNATARAQTNTQNNASQTAINSAFSDWLAATNERDIKKQMTFYAPKVAAYYRTRNASRADVQAEKTRVFDGAKSVQVRSDKPEIKLDRTGTTATMRFHKRYEIDGNGKNRNDRRGEVIQELRWQKTDAGWKIVSERDVQVIN